MPQSMSAVGVLLGLIPQDVVLVAPSRSLHQVAAVGELINVLRELNPVRSHCPGCSHGG